MLYGTTKKFLQLYGLRNLRDLPQAKEMTAEGGLKKTAQKKPAPGAGKSDDEDETRD
jgi:hypothetical protein